MQKKRILGSWFEFEHHSSIEGLTWNKELYRFTDDMWKTKVDEMADLGMEYIVLLSTALNDEAYFDTNIYPKSGHVCQDPIRVLLEQAEKRNMKVFLSVGYYGNWMDPVRNMIDEGVTKRAFQAIKEMYELYGSCKSFYGWYLPDETCIAPYFTNDFYNYVNRYSRYVRSFDPSKKVLIAPYGTRIINVDDYYINQLKGLEVDFIAYQDEVGVRKSQVEETAEFYKKLKEAHDKAAGPALWADIELFEFEEETYQSQLLPADFSRIKKQIEQVTPYVDVILAYQYIGIMNPTGTKAPASNDREKSYALYNEYKAWLDE